MTLDCPLPEGWVTYTLTDTDTLFALAAATGSSVNELIVGNCLSGAETPLPGMTIALPRPFVEPVAVYAPVVPEASPPQVGCTFPGSVITAPLPGEELDGVFSVIGTASQDSFAYYRIEIRPDAAQLFNLYSRSEVQIFNGTLAEVNTHLFGDGLHWIRLTLVQPNGEFPTPCAIPVIFR
ncbi:MAG: hypothetical protein IPK17_01785 [Chloroflexi bacterium]|uniref:hypothetical protein n=1 Tax=Candidatus Flexifilum breve TaxID=3140694 RepID=UPI0031354664|nr:hypothetical protein [Chloroflexota bacterium]